MKYEVIFSEEFEKSFLKMMKKDRARFNQIQKKLIHLVENPERYKPLRNDLAGYRRLHFGPFVLIYTINSSAINIISLDHHDKAY
jgi:YafQ family addiction module toxin component